MERESFEDAEVAAVLNNNFVSVKVDKEERPDVDAVYMQVCQAFTGQGGWPLTLFLTPDKKAFFAGTYFPKSSRYGMSGLLEVLAAVEKLWKSDREKLVRQGNEIIKRIGGIKVEKAGNIAKNDFHIAFETFRRSFDEQYGGFGRAPKFPTPHNLMFLLRYFVFEHRKEALELVETTLRAMYRGGMFDHVGYGFSRYSTDDRWLVPHFEKMLYDNALLSLVYLETYQVTGDDFYKRIAEKTLDYILREMTDIEGGFYSAQDADSEGEEGKYYVFTPESINAILGEEDGGFFCRYFGIKEAGNFEGASILNLLENEAYDKSDKRIESLLPKIYEYRLNRTKLFKDKKILTSWNAMAITAFAKAGALGAENYLNAAERAAWFIKEKLTRADGTLYVRSCDGEAAGTGYLDDYAFTAWAMLALYEATFNIDYLESAIHYAEIMCELFEDKENGGYYLYSEESEALVIRPKETYDGATPSGNSVAAFVLCRLGKLTADERWEESSKRQLDFMASPIKAYPTSHSFGLMAAQLELYPSQEVVCTAASQKDVEQLKTELAKVYLPNLSLLVKTKENAERINMFAPFTKGYLITADKTHYYICKNKTCSVPFTGADVLVKRVKETYVPAKR